MNCLFPYVIEEWNERLSTWRTFQNGLMYNTSREAERDLAQVPPGLYRVVQIMSTWDVTHEVPPPVVTFRKIPNTDLI